MPTQNRHQSRQSLTDKASSQCDLSSSSVEGPFSQVTLSFVKLTVKPNQLRYAPRNGIGPYGSSILRIFWGTVILFFMVIAWLQISSIMFGKIVLTLKKVSPHNDLTESTSTQRAEETLPHRVCIPKRALGWLDMAVGSSVRSEPSWTGSHETGA